FPANPFLQLTLPRVNPALDRLQKLIWREVAPVRVSFAGNQPEHLNFDQARRRNFKPVKLPHHWGQLFDQGWFKLDLPKITGREHLYLHWLDQGEGTVYLDGTPYYGFDVAHRHCPLPRSAKSILIEGLCLQSAIWHPEAKGIDSAGSRLDKAALVTRND